MDKSSSIKHFIAAVLLTVSASPFSSVGYAATNSQQLSDLAKVSLQRQAEIKQAIQQGLLVGDPNGNFRPYDSITRQDMAVILSRALQLPAAKHTHSSFSDVKQANWAASSIEAVRQAGFMTGSTQGQFRPKAPMTYQELAVVLSRAIQWQTEEADNELVKEEMKTAAPWAREALQQSAAEGVFSESELLNANQPVQRQVLAGILLDSFFPENRPATLQRVNDTSVRINGISYSLSDQVSRLLSFRNAKVLEGAKIKYSAEGRTLLSVASLEIKKSGSPAEKGKAEFSGNLELDGGGATLGGDLKISGDYVSVTNLTVDGDFEITSKLAHDFYAKNLAVSGQTRVNGGDDNTVVFENASLGQVDVNKQGVHVEAVGSTAIDKATVSSDATLTFGNAATVKQVSLQDGAANVALSGNIGVLELAGGQKISVTGSAKIGEVQVNGSGAASLNLAGNVQRVSVNNPNGSVAVGGNTKVETVSLGANVPASAVSGVAAPSGAADASESSQPSPSPSPSPLASPSPAPASPTPAPVNQAPIATRVMEDQSFSITDGSVLVDVTGLFTDPDNDKLTVGALTSNRNVVTVKLTGNSLSLVPVAAGSAVITLRASDGKGHLTSAAFNVTVTETPATPVPTPTPSPEPTPTPSPEPTPTPSPEPTPTPSPEPTPTPSPEPTPTPSPEPTPTPSPEPTPTPSPEPTPTPSPEPTPTPSPEPTPTPSPEPTPTPSPEPTPTPSPEPTPTPSPEPTPTPSPEPTPTPSPEPTPTPSPEPTPTPSLEPTPTPSSEPTPTPSPEPTPTPSPEPTPTPSPEPTPTPNQVPVGVDIPDQTLDEGAAAKDIDLAQYFSDPDQDLLTYSVTVSDSTIASVSVNGSILTISPVMGGNVFLTVKAIDSKGGSAEKTINLTVTPKAPNKAPEVVSMIQTQVLSPGYTNERSYDLSQLFTDPEGDVMTYTAVSNLPGAAQVNVGGSVLTLSPGTAGHTGAVVVTITATDSKGNQATYDLNVVAVSLVNNGYIPVNTKAGVSNLTVNLNSYFPNDPTLQQYLATPDQTLTGPTTMYGKVWSNSPMAMDYWVVGADYKAVLIRVSVSQQTNNNAYFSQYIDGGDNNKTFQILNPYYGTNQKFAGFSLEMVHYNPATNQTSSSTYNILDLPSDLSQGTKYVNYIDRGFYEFFDLIPTAYYNDELILNIPGSRLTAIILKKDGQIIDVMGDPKGQTELLPNGGTIIRKSSIHSSSLTYNLPGEWNLYPKGTYQYYNQQTP
ncbi:S-layer homology domain-containing protein [Paenibacillus sp. CN-4]|uniref:S-layer homology domain-containing protein n=1 Tax=Paenibacillus nanchangensis TaxID=3348343 RepID=UPI0039788BCF